MLTYILRFAALTGLGLLATVSYAAAKPAAPASASSSARPLAKPVWPNNGIAQRRFDVGALGAMFVEDRRGKLSAWVLSTYTRSMMIDQGHAYVEALNFFTGKVMKVKVDLEDDGSEGPTFTDPKGVTHSGGDDSRFQFSGHEVGISLSGVSFGGDATFFDGTIGNCYANLNAATREAGDDATGAKSSVTWNKFPLYHRSASPKGCSSGEVESTITSALDLGDGTFLAEDGCFIFRLRKSDLLPVGAASALTVVDESTLKAVIAKANRRPIKDATGYLIKALHLPTAPDVSCKEY